jgi:DNA-binding winged helix-turn-helix (wHTH) protein
LKDLLERVGRPLTEDFSTVNGDGFRFNEAITEAAIAELASAFLFSQSPVYPQLCGLHAC